MATQALPATSRPYEHSSPYEMSGGSGAPVLPEDGSSRPWDQPTSHRPEDPSSYPPDHSGSYRPDRPSSYRPDDSAAYGPEQQSSSYRPEAGMPPVGPDPQRPGMPYGGSVSYPGPNPHGPVVEQMTGPAGMPPTSQPGGPADFDANMPIGATGLAMTMPTAPPQGLRGEKTSFQFALDEYRALQRKRARIDASASTTTLDLERQIQDVSSRARYHLGNLRSDVSIMVSEAQKQRWRRWLIGGVVGSIIPTIKYIFRRSAPEKEEDKTVTDTEHAFSRSQALLSRIKDTVLGRNGFASMAFFVFAVLYVFTNEVRLMVAKTVNKRLRGLQAKLERSDEEITEKDLKMLEGWRWRVLLWRR